MSDTVKATSQIRCLVVHRDNQADFVALEWIREYTEADVRYYLLNTDLSVKEIAEELGFPNLSFFGKFCRRAFGKSPNDFRKQMKTDVFFR